MRRLPAVRASRKGFKLKRGRAAEEKLNGNALARTCRGPGRGQAITPIKQPGHIASQLFGKA
jgi:hypothetical protein